MSSTAAVDRKHFILPNTQPFASLECSGAFERLTAQERLYAHHLSRASWAGGLIAVVQCSPEAPLIHALLHRIFARQSAAELRAAVLTANAATADEVTAFLVYAAAVYANAGNYKMGDSKIVPGLSQEAFGRIVAASAAAQQAGEEGAKVAGLWKLCGAAVFRLDERTSALGLAPEGVTTYFSDNCTREDADRVNGWLKRHQLEAYVCRTFKTWNAADERWSFEVCVQI